jgi:hypothetical protein
MSAEYYEFEYVVVTRLDMKVPIWCWSTWWDDDLFMCSRQHRIEGRKRTFEENFAVGKIVFHNACCLITERSSICRGSQVRGETVIYQFQKVSFRVLADKSSSFLRKQFR